MDVHECQSHFVNKGERGGDFNGVLAPDGQKAKLYPLIVAAVVVDFQIADLFFQI